MNESDVTILHQQQHVVSPSQPNSLPLVLIRWAASYG